MKRKVLFDYVQQLNNVSELKGVKFSYTLVKNKKKIEEEIKVLEEVVKPTEKYIEFEKMRISLCEFYSEKDANNNPITENNQYKISDPVTFNEELVRIKTEYQDVITERENQITEYNKLLDEEVTMEFNKLNFADLPTDITASQLESIEFMINF